MKIQSSVRLLYASLLFAVPADCEEIDHSNSLPLKVLHYRAHGWYGDTEKIEASGRRSLFSGAAESSIEEIGLERSRCSGFGICPSDSYRVKSNGEFFYWGDAKVQRLGCFKAKNPVEDLILSFEILAEILDEIELWEMQDSYATTSLHGFSTYYSIVRDSEQKVILNYDSAGPVELFLFEEYFFQMMDDLRWKKVKQADSAIKCLQLDIAEPIKGDCSRGQD